MITRTFHPVGQGAFYSEKHECGFLTGEAFYVVYDCGNWKNEKFANAIIEASCIENGTINLLFISHFDFDHVSGIKILIDKCHIKRVVLPLLHEEEKQLLTRFYTLLGFKDEVALVNKPEEFFSDNTSVTFVEQSIDYPSNQENLTVESDSIGKIISSSTVIELKNTAWVYIPYNHMSLTRRIHLKYLIKKAGLDYKKLIKSASYAIHNRKTLKGIYNSLSGKINENSMLVYSGPSDIKHAYKRYFHDYVYPIYYWKIDNRLRRVACIYTGDTNLNKICPKLAFHKVWDNVGTIQVPHHGDGKSFNDDILNDEFYCCPYSYGKKNTYGHPSSIVNIKIDTCKSHAIEVTDDPKTKYTETIKC